MVAAATAIKRVKEAYGFAPGFERALATMVCGRPKFFGRFAMELDDECLHLAPAKLAIRVAKMIARETQRGPGAPILVIQRLNRLMGEGKVTREDIIAVAEMFDDAEDAGLPSEEQAINEVVPILKRRIEREAIEAGTIAYGRRSDLGQEMGRILHRARKVGQENEEGIGALLGPATFEEMSRLNRVQRMSTFVPELDDLLGGGVHRNTLTVFVAATGGGKSMSLIQMAVSAAAQGFHVGYATLELPRPIIAARIKANITGIPIDEILADPVGSGAAERLAEVQSREGFGRIVIKTFTPKATTVSDLRDWRKEAEDEWGQRMDVWCIDYLDKVKSRGLSQKQQEHSYTSQGEVYDEVYADARDDSRWAYTASQGTRQKDAKNKKLDVDDVADSMNKARNADLVITCNPRDEGQAMLWHLAKNRLGVAHKSAGPLPCDFTIARPAPVNYVW